jgi:Smg protein
MLLSLERAQVLDAAQRELVIERLLALDADEAGTEQLKWVVLMVLSSQPGGLQSLERLGSLVAEVRVDAPH